MKWTEKQTAELKALCFDEVPNAQLAEHFGVPVTEIHAKRSQLGITIPKVKAAKGSTSATAEVKTDTSVSTAKTGLSRDVKESFEKLKTEILLKMASDHISINRAKAYGYLHSSICALEAAFDSDMRDEE